MRPSDDAADATSTSLALLRDRARRDAELTDALRRPLHLSGTRRWAGIEARELVVGDDGALSAAVIRARVFISAEHSTDAAVESPHASATERDAQGHGLGVRDEPRGEAILRAP